MKPLSKEASAALSALQAIDPTTADEARVRRNLERALGVVVPAASVAVATTAASAHAATGASLSSGMGVLGLGAKAVAFVMAVGVGAAVTVSTVTAVKTAPQAVAAQEIEITIDAPTVPPERSRGATAELEIAPVSPAPAPPIAPPESSRGVTAEPEVEIATAAVQPRLRAPPPPPNPRVEFTSAPAPAAAPEKDVLPPPPSPPSEPEVSEAAYELEVEANFPTCDVKTEMKAALSARRLLNADRAEESLFLLGAYQRHCPSGRWSNEAWVVRMAGLCHLDRNAEVIGLLQWFSTEYPGRRTAVVSELGRFCSDEVLKHGEPSAE
ncbi:MAG: hypothetical protein Q8K32_17560 [Archangium sp.]|nr:hypothetical protein [Archangium sp.]